MALEPCFIVRDCIKDPRTQGARVSEADKAFYVGLRKRVAAFTAECSSRYCTNVEEGILLDVAPQVHEGAKPYFPSQLRIETLDIDPSSGATYIADLTKANSNIIPSERFHYILCTEVLEHTVQPFLAFQELFRMLRPGGLLFLSVPCNFRIHGPLPDCWRFTEHGLRALASSFNLQILSLEALETPDRELFPIHYTMVAKKP